METFFIKALQLILAFAILVIIHEFGHFLFARVFGIRVEKFYIFFNPWKSLFKWKPGKYWGFLGKKHYFKGVKPDEADEKPAQKEVNPKGEVVNTCEKVVPTDAEEIKVAPAETKAEEEAPKSFWGDTEYGVGWLPLGGYCKISGMIDESMDTEQMKKPAKEWEFRSKPAWQRLLVMIAGVLFNFLLAILIYAGIVYVTGEKYVPMRNATMGMDYSPAAHAVGFKDGDIPLTADGEELVSFAEARTKIASAQEVKVLRGNDTVSLSIPGNFMLKLNDEAESKDAQMLLFCYRFPARIMQIMPGEGAAKAGLKVGDDLIAIDSVSVPTVYNFLTALEGHENQTVNITAVRHNDSVNDTITVPVKLSDASKMGIGLQLDPSDFYQAEEINYSLLSSIPRGITLGVDQLTGYAKSMKLVFTKEGAKSVGGFGTLGSIFPEKWNWIAFWNIAAFLSVALAFMNILPIPGLDGGHVLFLIYEIIFRRPPSQKFLEHAQIVGMVLLLLLLIYANGMDIVRLFK